ncbi:hypothetical protein BMG05_18460 [Mycobacterium malmoense]|nr:hypothetical protein BMG05_18460 [Mycobacterium malmoense]
MKRVPLILAVAAAAAIGVAPAHADPPPWNDPHYPDKARGSCPGGSGGFGIGWCDGQPYPDGTYWHQTTWGGQYGASGGGKPQCMGPDHNPAPPGGCGGYG